MDHSQRGHKEQHTPKRFCSAVGWGAILTS